MDFSDTRTALRRAVPFLRAIPDDIWKGIHPGELIIPEGDSATARIGLENALGAHVMTYRREVFLKDVPASRHLCGHLLPASLNEAQKEMLDTYESRFVDEGVSFVAYAKPLVIIPVEDSALYKGQIKEQKMYT